MIYAILTTIFLFLSSSHNAYSDAVSSSTARSAADTFMSGRSGIQAAKSTHDTFLFDTQAVMDDKGRTIAYVHSFDQGGYVITAADDRITPVLGYSDKGSFDFTDSDQNFLLYLLKIDIPIRLDALEEGDDAMLERSIENSAQWNDLANGIFAAKKADAKTYGPLIQTNWNQDFPYNKYCPLDPTTGLRSFAGCYAAAIAQICNYWQYPKSLSFDAGDSYISKGDNGDISIFEDAERLDFPTIDELNGALGTISYNDDMESIAWLMSGIGIKIITHYSSDGSGTADSVYPFYIVGFTSSYGSLSWADDYPHAIDDIVNGIPVGLGLNSSVTESGHAVILDGYDEASGLFHLNPGWGDQDDTNRWYSLPDIDLEEYDSIWGFIYNIKPEQTVEFEEIHGTVFDPDGAPLNLATVKVNPGGATAYTDETGTFSFRLPTGTNKTITVNHPSYAYYMAPVSSGDNTVRLAELDDPTLLWYHFDSDGSDASGRGNDISYDPAFVSLVPGRYGNAVSVSAQFSLIKAEIPALYTNADSEMTIESWVQITTDIDETVNQYILSATPRTYIMGLVGTFSVVSIYYAQDGNNTTLRSSHRANPFTIGDWVHIAIVNSNRTARLYVNGILEYETEIKSDYLVQPGGDLVLGIQGESLYETPAIMDETRISAAALQPGEFIGGEFKGSLTVSVSDGESGVFSDAEVTVEPGGYTMISGEDGLVQFDNIPARDDYTVTVSAEGYDPVTAVDIEVATGNGASLAIDITGNVVGVGNDIPIAFELGNPFPNPFNAGVNISYSLAETAPVELTLYSIGGQVVKTISKGTMHPGRYSESIDSAGLPNGVFFIKLSAGNRNAVKKVVHVK